MTVSRPVAPDPVRAYLDRIGRIPRLTAAQELELGAAVAAGARARDRLASPESCEGDRARLLLEVRDGDAARTTMVSANLRLVVAQARRFPHTPVPFLDLIQEGNVGLVHAADKFDASLGFRFSTYATDWIAQAIGQALASDRLIRLPPKINGRLLACRWVRDLLHDELGRSPSAQEIAESVELDELQVRRVLRADSPPLSLDHPGARDLAEQLDDGVEQPAVQAQRGVVVQVLDDAVAQLCDVERNVLRLRFGLGCRRHSRDEVAETLDIAATRVRAIESLALQHMRGRPAVIRLRDDLSA